MEGGNVGRVNCGIMNLPPAQYVQPDTGISHVTVTGMEGGEDSVVNAVGNMYIGPGHDQFVQLDTGNEQVRTLIGQEASNQPGNAPGIDKTRGYKMDADPRGLCLIFNNKTFEGKENRTGTDNDRDELKRVFEKLKFRVKVFDNADADVMELKVRMLSESSHKEYDCVIVIFLTHGKDGAVQGSDNDWLRISTITSFFKASVCPTLANKPKLFFFQSCRGNVFQKGAKVEGDGNEGAIGGTEMERLVAPEADFFFGYSTVSGTKSVRNVETGSWYIQELIRALDRYADKEDLQTLMTRVAKGVNDHMVECEDGTFIRQTAEFASRLLKPLYF